MKSFCILGIYLYLFYYNDFVYSYPSLESNNGVSLRIAGGKPAKLNQFPYQVGLSIMTSKGLSWCGGAFISNQVILTAAHCLFGATQATAYYGSINQGGPYDKNQIKLGSLNFVMHPQYNNFNMANDIALIKLSQPVKFSEGIKAISLPKSDIYSNGLSVVVSGWGLAGDSQRLPSKVLQYVNLNLMSLETCKRFFSYYIRPQHLCADGSKKKSACQGDSGGPLVAEVEGVKTVIGVVSFGGDGCEKGYPTVYTRVYSYLDWIKKNGNLS